MGSSDASEVNGSQVAHRRSLRWITSGLALVILLALTALITLPHLIAYGAKQWVLANGGDHFSVENVDFNPFTATFALHNLEIHRGGKSTLQIPNLKLHMAWRPLFQQQIVIRGLTLKGLRLDIDHSQPELLPLIGGILLPASSSATSDSPPWKLQLQRLTLVESTLGYQRPGTVSELIIDKLWLTGLEGLQPDTPARLTIQGSIDNAEIGIDGQLTPFATAPAFSGKIQLKRLTLQRYAALLKPAISQLNGSLTIDSDFTLRQEIDGSINLAQQGSIRLDGLNLTNPELIIKESRLDWSGRIDSQLALNGQKTALQIEGKLASGNLSLEQPNQAIRLTKEQLRWQGKAGVSLDTAGTRISTSGSINIDQLAVALGETRVAAGKLQLTSSALKLKQQETNLELTHQGSISLSALSMSDPQMQLASDQLDWQGVLQVASKGSGTQEISAKGTFDSQRLESTLAEINTRGGYDRLGWSGEIQLSSQAPGVGQLVQQGDIHLTGATLTTPQIDLTEQLLAWSGRLQLESLNEKRTLSANGTLGSQQMTATLSDQEMTLAYSSLNWEGELAGSGNDGLEQLDLAGSLALEQALISNPADRYTLASLASLKMDGIAGDALGEVTSVHTAITDLAVGRADSESAASLHHSDLVELTGMAYAPQTGVAIEAIKLTGSRGKLLRQQDKAWNFARLSSALGGDKKSDEITASAPLPVRIGKISLQGDNLISFEDQSISPAYKTEMTIERFELGQIDSQQPQSPSSMTLETRLGQSSRINLSGQLQPFAEQLTLDLKGQITGLELPPLSPYAAPAIGYRLNSGELSADIVLQADSGLLKGTNQLTIHQLDITPLNPEEKKEAKGDSVPLETALGMLRDRNNTIRLALPVSGEINNLKVDPSDAINQALGSAIKSGAKTYLTAALFPFGTLLSIAQAASEEAAKIKLDPIVFDAGNSELKENHLKYLEKIAQVLNDRPEIHIKLCGIAVESDRKSLSETPPPTKTADQGGESEPGRGNDKTATEATITPEQLLQLAVQRTAVIEQHLTSRHKIKADRLISCQPQIEGTPADAKPRADLLI